MSNEHNEPQALKLRQSTKKRAVDAFVRTRGVDVTEHEQEEHAQCLNEDSAYQRAYNDVKKEWHELDGLTGWAHEELQRLENKEPVKLAQQRKFTFFQLATAATVAMGAVALLLLFPLFTSNSQQYETLKGEQRRIVLEDGSRAHLNSGSSIEVEYTADMREIRFLKGEGLFDVAHGRSRPFVVRVRDKKVIAVGTSFNVYYEHGTADVTVLEGQVAVVPDGHSASDATAKNDLSVSTQIVKIPGVDIKGVLLEPDHQVRIGRKGEIGPVKTVDAQNYTAWDRGLIVFDSTPLSEVAQQLSRYVIGDIRVVPEVAAYPVTGVLKIQDKQSMLKLLAQVVPITPVQQSSQVTFLYTAKQDVTRDSENQEIR